MRKFAMFHNVMQNKTKTIGVRVSDDSFKLIQNAGEITGIEPANLGRAALEAVVKYVQEHGEIVMPLRVVSCRDYERLFPSKKKK